MAEKNFPNSKPAAGNPPVPTTKAQLYNHSRPVYRPQPRRSRRSRRSCCCFCCLWITFTLAILLLIAAAAGGVAYVFYRPHRPTFAVSSLRVAQFNLTSSNKLNTRFNFTVTTRNPNNRIVFDYDPVSVTFTSKNLDVGDGSIPSFTTEEKKTMTLTTVASADATGVDDDKTNSDSNDSNDLNDLKELKSDLKSKSLILKIELDTKVKAKIGSFESKKVPIKVTCDGIKAVAPSGKAAATAATSDVQCKVDLRFKIWKWRI